MSRNYSIIINICVRKTGVVTSRSKQVFIFPLMSFHRLFEFVHTISKLYIFGQYFRIFLRENRLFVIVFFTCFNMGC